MRRLVSVEVGRMRRRRLNVIVVGAALLGIGIAATVLFFKTSTDVEGAIARARIQQRADFDRCLREVPPEFRDATPPPGSEGQFEAPCGVFDASQVTADPLFHMRDYLNVVKGTAPVMIVMSLLLGASFIGAEWHNRTITTTLTWEPRRGRLLAAKALGCAGVIFLTVVALQAVLGATLVPAAAAHGDFVGTGWSWFRSVAGAILRSAGTAALASVIGLSIASIGRNTVAAVGVAFGYFAVVENLIRGLKPSWQRWLFGDNAAVFVSGDRFIFPGGRTVLAAGVLISIYAVGAFAAAAAAFRARDVA